MVKSEDVVTISNTRLKNKNKKWVDGEYICRFD